MERSDPQKVLHGGPDEFMAASLAARVGEGKDKVSLELWELGMRHLSLAALPLLCILGTFGFACEALAGEAEAWAALQRGGMVVIMRHASAPGPEQGREGDPSGFVLEDCATQRNLSEHGREQATRLGEAMRAHHIVFARVMSSPWCRAKDTAILMNLGPSLELNRFLYNIGEHEAGAGEVNKSMPDPRMAIMHIHGIIRSWPGPGNLMLVSHGRTIAAVLYGPHSRSPEQAAAYVLEPTEGNKTGFTEIGSIPPPGGSHN